MTCIVPTIPVWNTKHVAGKENYYQVVTIKDDDGVVINLTGCTATLVFKDQAGTTVMTLSTANGAGPTTGEGQIINGTTAGTLTLKADISVADVLVPDVQGHLVIVWSDSRDEVLALVKIVEQYGC